MLQRDGCECAFPHIAATLKHHVTPAAFANDADVMKFFAFDALAKVWIAVWENVIAKQPKQ